MTPPNPIGREALILLTAAMIPLTAGAVAHHQQMNADADQVCVATEFRTPPPIVAVVPTPVVVPAPELAPDVAEVEPVPEVDLELPAGAFAFVVDLDGPHIVLSTEVYDDWVDGDPRVETPSRAGARLARDVLPEDLRSLVGKEVALYDEDGMRGVGWVGQPRIVAQADGELEGVDTYAAWEQFEDQELRAEVEEDVKLAREIWLSGRRLVVAPLDTDADGRWARLRSLPKPRVLASTDLPSDVIEEKVPWAWQDPAMLDWSGGYTLWQAETGEDRSVDISDMIGGTSWADDDGVAMVTFSVAGDSECGGYPDSVWGAVEYGEHDVKKSGIAGTDGERPASVFDINGDGRLDVLIPGDWGAASKLLLGTQGEDFIVALELPGQPFYGCPC